MVFQTEDRVHAAEGISRRRRRAAQGGRHAAGHRGRRDPAAQGPARAAEPGLSHDHRARAGDHPARRAAGRQHQGDRGPVRLGSQLPAGALRAAQRRRRRDGCRGAAQRRRCRRSIAREGGSASWGKHEGLSLRSALRGDGLHRLPLSLVQHGADGARTCRATPLVPSDFGDQPATERGEPRIPFELR